MTLWLFILIISSAFVLTNFGWLLAMVGIFALLTKLLLIVLAVLVSAAGGYGVWRLWRNRRQARTPRLIFKGK